MDNSLYEDLDFFNVQEFIHQKKSSIVLIMIPEHLICEPIVHSAALANGLSIRHAPTKFLSKRVLEAAVRENFRASRFIPKRLIYHLLVVICGMTMLEEFENSNNEFNTHMKSLFSKLSVKLPA